MWLEQCIFCWWWCVWVHVAGCITFSCCPSICVYMVLVWKHYWQACRRQISESFIGRLLDNRPTGCYHYYYRFIPFILENLLHLAAAVNNFIGFCWSNVLLLTCPFWWQQYICSREKMLDFSRTLLLANMVHFLSHRNITIVASSVTCIIWSF